MHLLSEKNKANVLHIINLKSYNEKDDIDQIFSLALLHCWLISGATAVKSKKWKILTDTQTKKAFGKVSVGTFSTLRGLCWPQGRQSSYSVLHIFLCKCSSFKDAKGQEGQGWGVGQAHQDRHCQQWQVQAQTMQAGVQKVMSGKCKDEWTLSNFWWVLWVVFFGAGGSTFNTFRGKVHSSKRQEY